MVIVVNGVESGEVLERWVFQVEQAVDKENGGLVQQQVYIFRCPRRRDEVLTLQVLICSQTSKSRKEIAGEISALLRQVTATVTFLPMLGTLLASSKVLALANFSSFFLTPIRLTNPPDGSRRTMCL